MRRYELSRNEFVAWLGDQESNRQFVAPRKGSSTRGDLTLILPDEGVQSTPIVAVDASEVRDFLAFATTYVGTYVPFTAFFRVMAREMAEVLPDRQVHIPERAIEALIGTVICDAAVQMRDGLAPKISDITLQACLATPSAAVVQAALLGYDSHLAHVVLQRWFSIWEEMPNGRPRVQPEHRILLWTTILSALFRSGSSHRSEDRLVEEFISAVYEGGGVAPERALREMGLETRGGDGLASALRGNREERVRVLEQFVDSKSSARSLFAGDMLLGYLAAQVAEGSLSYIQVASRFADNMPLSVLWFGFFSGLNRNNDVLTAGECLGRRIARRLNPHVGIGPVWADLSYEEFTLLLQEGRIGKMRTDSQSVIEVELLPGVTGRYRIPRGSRTNESAQRTVRALEEVKRISAQLQSVLRNVEVEPRPLKSENFELAEQKPSSPKSRNSSKRKYK